MATNIYTETCDAAGCNRPQQSRGYCTMHYQRYIRHGSPYINHQRRHDLTPFGEWLVERITDAGYTMTGFTERVGVSQRAMNYWLIGRQYPLVLTVDRIATALDLPVSVVVGAIVDDAIERGLTDDRLEI